jgi:hypothetical protein
MHGCCTLEGMTSLRIRSPFLRAMAWFVAWMAFGFSLIQSVSIAVEWWQEKLTDAGAWEWFWIAMLPVLVFIFLRYFSIFNPSCRACLPPDATKAENKPAKQ